MVLIAGGNAAAMFPNPEKGNGPLAVAIQEGKHDIASVLMEFGNVDPAYRNEISGYTLLHDAVTNIDEASGNVDLGKFRESLRHHPALQEAVSMRDDRGMLPLFRALKPLDYDPWGITNKAAFHFMMSLPGADINSRMSDTVGTDGSIVAGPTLMDWAMEQGLGSDQFKLLLEYGAKFSDETRNQDLLATLEKHPLVPDGGYVSNEKKKFDAEILEPLRNEREKQG